MSTIPTPVNHIHELVDQLKQIATPAHFCMDHWEDNGGGFDCPICLDEQLQAEKAKLRREMTEEHV